MSLDKALGAWAKTEKGKKQLMRAKNAKTVSAGTTGNISGNKGEFSAEDIASNIIALFSSFIEDAGFEFGDYLNIIGASAIRIGDEVVWQIDVDFDRSKIHRDSWYPEKYPFGAYDIVQLMNNGYIAEDRVYKVEMDENGHKTSRPSLQVRDGAHFMNRAELYANEHSARSGYWVEIHPRFVDGLGN